MTTAPASNGMPRYSVVTYDAHGISEHLCRDLDEAFGYYAPGRVNWITVRDVHDDAELMRLLEFFELEASLLGEILDEMPSQFEIEYQNCLYLEYVVPHTDLETDRLEPSKGSFILGRDFVILYEHDVHGLFARTRRRILGQQTKAMHHGPDYLLYLLLRAAIVEHYQLTFKKLTLKLEALEDVVLDSGGRQETYQEILSVREEVKPWNDPLLELQDFLEFVKDAESRFISDQSMKLFTKDLDREVADLLDYYDHLHTWLKEIMDLHMANVQTRANRVMQLLTVIATIFLPLTFVASVYGMNFRHMPLLEHPLGFWIALLFMVALALGGLAYMRNRRWF